MVKFERVSKPEKGLANNLCPLIKCIPILILFVYFFCKFLSRQALELTSFEKTEKYDMLQGTLKMCCFDKKRTVRSHSQKLNAYHISGRIDRG